ncbi:MAG: triose-phosphate isomerase, partial [Pirellulales bacterium]
MRRFFIAGNWKMNLDRDAAVTLATQLAMKAASVDSVDIAVCPPSVYVDSVATAVDGSNVAVGAQNMHHEPSGAFTGEISAAMLL